MTWSSRSEAEVRRLARHWCLKLRIRGDDAEDVEQDCVVKALVLCREGRLRGERALWSLTRGVAMDALTRRALADSLFCELGEAVVDPDVSGVEVAELLAEFPEMEAVAHARMEGIDWETVAGAVGVSPVALTARWGRFVRRAKRVLSK